MNLDFKIKYLVLICLIFIGISPTYFAQSITEECFSAGADRTALYLPLLKDKTIGIVTNQTGLLKDRTHLVDFLVKNNIKIKTIFAPEHGFRGTADAGETVKNGLDAKTKIPIVSLYGSNKKPSVEQLKGIDILLFDIQDVGVRFYTYISTLSYLLEAGAENKIPIIILDRPNPHDGYIDGPVLQPSFSSFVGLHKVPVVYGLTIAEYGKMAIGEGWLKNGVIPEYTVIPMLNYHKKKRYPISEKPSPNLPNTQSIALYPSLCFFEGTQISVGRGTALPFQIYGAPELSQMQYSFTPKPSLGAKDPFLNGQLCFGENLSTYSTPVLSLHLEWLIKAFNNYKKPKNTFFLSNLFFDKLAGTDALRKQILGGVPIEEIRKSWEKELKEYELIRKKYVLYED